MELKTIAFQLTTILVSIILVDFNADPVLLGDIGIIEKIMLISGLTFMVAIGVFAIIIFRSVWVKQGYAGVDKILEGKEVGLFMSHVLAFGLLEVFFFMILFYQYITPPSYAFWICGAGFLSPEAVGAIKFIANKIKSKNGAN